MWLCERFRPANRILIVLLLFQPFFLTGRRKDEGWKETQEGIGETKRCGTFPCSFSVRLGSLKVSGPKASWSLFSSLPFSSFPSSPLLWTHLSQTMTNFFFLVSSPNFAFLSFFQLCPSFKILKQQTNHAIKQQPVNPSTVKQGIRGS